MRKTVRAFTLIELIIGVSLFLSLLALGWSNISTLPGKITLNTVSQNLINDLRNQQSESMNGVNTYGIYIENTSYTLFKGLIYNPNDSTNLTVRLDDSNLSLSTMFPNSIIVFKSSSGEVNNFDSNNNTITITDNLSGSTQIIKLNKYGTPIE